MRALTNKYAEIGCVPCDREMWLMLNALEAGWVSPYGTKADSKLFDHLRAYPSLPVVPCCHDNRSS
jgi:hypothetical protein